MAQLEHANITVRDIDKMVAWMTDIFGWHVRWDGDGMGGAGRSLHIGTDDSYLALYTPHSGIAAPAPLYSHASALNHLAVTVDDLDATRRKVVAQGFAISDPEDYDPGRRFYFFAEDDLEFEVVCYD